MHSSFYSCLGRVLIILSAPSEVFSSPHPPRQAPQLLSECLIKLPLIFLFFSLSPYVSRLLYRPSSSQRGNSPVLSLGISPFSYCDWNFSGAGEFTLWGMTLNTESSGVGKAFHAETGNPSLWPVLFPCLGCSWDLGK